MMKIFSCSSSQFPVDKWNRYDQKLVEAVERGDSKKVSAILSKRPIRATKNAPNGQSAFHLAAARGLTECVNVIISHKVEINAKTDDGCTALHLAASNCHPEIVKQLLQHGAHEDSIDFHSRTPLHCAATSGCVSSVLLLCDAEDTILDAADDDGRTPLMIAAQRNHPTVCSLLLDRGANVNLCDRDKKTALILACEKGNIQGVETLITKGADPQLKDNKFCDALSYASLSRDNALKKLVQSALDRRKNAQSQQIHSDQTSPQVVPPTPSQEQELVTIWKKRFHEEQKRGVWLQGELMTKTQEIERLAEERRVENNRIQELAESLESFLDRQPDNLGAMAGVPTSDTCGLLTRVLDYVRTLKEKIHEKTLLDQRIQTLTSKAAEAEKRKDQHQEETRRLQSDVAAAKEKEEGARKKVMELEGHLENMREALSQFEKRKRIQSTVVEDLQEQISDVTKEKEELLVLLQKLQEENVDNVQTKRSANGQVLTEKTTLDEFLMKLKGNCVNVEVRQNNEVSKSRSGYVPKDILEKSPEDWKANVVLLENYIATTERLQQNVGSMQRADLDLVNGTTNEKAKETRSINILEHSPLLETNVPCLQEDLRYSPKNSIPQPNRGPSLSETQGSDHARTINSLKQTIRGLETELSSLQATNADFLSKMNQVIQEKQNLEEGLLALQESMQSEFTMRQEMELRCKDYKYQTGVLSDELQAEQDKLKKLNSRLEAHQREVAMLRDSFPPEVLQVENNRTVEMFSSDILEELYWNVGTLVRKYNEASQQVAALQKENLKLLDDRVQTISMTEHKNILNEMKNDLHAKVKETEDVKQKLFQTMGSVVELKDQLALQASNSVPKAEVESHMEDLESVVMALKEENEACKVALEGKCEEAIVLKQQLEQEAEESQALRQREVHALQEFERVRGNLETQLRALREEIQVLTKECNKTTEEANRWKYQQTSEQEKRMVLEGKAKELEREAEDLKRKVQKYEEENCHISRKYNLLSRVSQEKQEKVEASVKESKSLSKEIEQLQRRCTDLVGQMEDTNKRHQETIATYRTHLLNAAQGFMDEDVHLTLHWILKMQNDIVY
ncbi:PREDICTED: ankyrin repeat domain-containing protein 35 [Nanorana parkeri]|uniref:ankyrin repeat domain-containing protein 35 n=1 Tax=Nanorana parkeri TaxID=125878 RepID=UPI00085404CA|nr:PREDICTED: ankyrin repeat domain-containing protein 35 [Nanorana parkeri]